MATAPVIQRFPLRYRGARHCGIEAGAEQTLSRSRCNMNERNIGNGKGIGVSAEPETCTTAPRLAERTRKCRAPFELHRGSAPRRGRARGAERRRRKGKDPRVQEIGSEQD